MNSRIILMVIAQVVISASAERVASGPESPNPQNLEFVPLPDHHSQRFPIPNSLNAIPKEQIQPAIQNPNEKILNSAHYTVDSSEETERFADIEQKLLENPIHLTDPDPLPNLETLPQRKHSEDSTKHKCMQRYNLQEKKLEEGGYAKSLRQEVSKLQDLVQVLRDQQYILRILNDVDGKPYSDPKSIQHSLIKHLKKISEQEAAPKQDAVDIRDNVDEEHRQVTNLKKEVSTLKKLITKPHGETELAEQLKTQKDEIVLLKTMMGKMLKEIPKINVRHSDHESTTSPSTSTSTEASTSSTVSTEKIGDEKSNSTSKLRESSDTQNVSAVLQQLAKLQQQLTKIISTPKTPTSQEVVGAFLPSPELAMKPLNNLLASTNIFHRRNQQKAITKPHPIHQHHPQHYQLPIYSTPTNSTARQANDEEIDSLLNLLNDNKKSGSLELGDDSSVNKLLNSLGQAKSDSLELEGEEDIQDRLLDLQKQLKKNKKKKKKTTIEDQLKKLEKQIKKDDDLQSKTIDDDDGEDDPKAQLKKLQLTIKKLNKKSKVQSKSDDDEDDVEAQLKGLQQAIKGLQPKEDDDDEVEEKNANFEFMLSKLVNKHKGRRPKLTAAQMIMLRKKLMAMKGHNQHGGTSAGYGAHNANEEDEAKPIFSYEEIDDESGEVAGHGYGGGAGGYSHGGQGSGSYGHSGQESGNYGHGGNYGDKHGGHSHTNYGGSSYDYSGKAGYGSYGHGHGSSHMSRPNVYGSNYGHPSYSSSFYGPGYGPGYSPSYVPTYGAGYAPGFGTFSAVLSPAASYNPSSGSYNPTSGSYGLPSTSYNPSNINYNPSSPSATSYGTSSGSLTGGYSSSGGNSNALSSASYNPPSSGISGGYSTGSTSYSPSSTSYTPGANAGYSSTNYNKAGISSGGNSNAVYMAGSNTAATGSYSPNTNNMYSPGSSSNYAPSGGSTGYIPSNTNSGYSASSSYGSNSPTYSSNTNSNSGQAYAANYPVPSQPQDSSKYISLFKQPSQYQPQQIQPTQYTPNQNPPISKPDLNQMNPHQIFEHISETTNDNFFPDKSPATAYGSDNRPDPPQPYQDPPANPRAEQKVSDLKNQIYELQNVIDTFNKPEYLQKPEDKETVYNLDRQIKDLKTVINNMTQDYPVNQNSGYQSQNYQGKTEAVQPVQYHDEKKGQNYAARFSREIRNFLGGIKEDFEPISCESNDDVIKPNEIIKDSVNHEDWMKIFEDFIKEENGGRKRRSRQARSEDSAETEEAVKTLSSLFSRALLGDGEESEMRNSHQPKLLNEVETRVKELKQQLDRRLLPKFRQNYNPYQPAAEEEQSKEIFKKPKKKSGIFDKIFDKILDKLVDKVDKILPKLLEVFFGKADFKDYMSKDYGNEYGNGYGNSLEKTFRGFGMSGFLPMVVLKLLSNLTYFVSYLQKYKFLRTFLVPALVLLLVAGSIIFLIWWLQPTDYNSSGQIGYDGHEQSNGYNNYGKSNGYSNYRQGYRSNLQYPGNSFSSGYSRNVYNPPSFRNTNYNLGYKNVNELENR